jgi:transaldolase
VSLLESLRTHSVIVVDTADFGQIARFNAADATTNPSLIEKAAHQDEYRPLVDEAQRFAWSRRDADPKTLFRHRLYVNFGREMLKIVPGRVSTETDARLSFDTRALIEESLELVRLYEQAGVERDRVLVKLATTWEGIVAAEQLEKRGIHCNMTLVFCLAQAAAAAQAGATLVSPFVGRIYDYYRKEYGVEDIPLEHDPGVASVTRIYDYLKHHDAATQVMGASFRKSEQILALAGCDLLTCSPELLSELDRRAGQVERRLDTAQAKAADIPRLFLHEQAFRWELNQDAMAVAKLGEGIRIFDQAARKLESLLGATLSRSEQLNTHWR